MRVLNKSRYQFEQSRVERGDFGVERYYVELGVRFHFIVWFGFCFGASCLNFVSDILMNQKMSFGSFLEKAVRVES